MSLNEPTSIGNTEKEELENEQIQKEQLLGFQPYELMGQCHHCKYSIHNNTLHYEIHVKLINKNIKKDEEKLLFHHECWKPD